MGGKLSRRHFLGTGVALTAANLLSGKTRAASGPAKGRVIILGFDGVEPRIVDEMLAAGKLPNLARLRDKGAYTRLATTIPPQSPVAWTSFATCKNPGGHGIFDFIRRNPKTHFPEVGTSRSTHPVLAADGSVAKPAESAAYRKGETFWSVADKAGLRCKILNVPFAYPPDKMKNGIMLCGLDVPDLRNSTSTFHSFSDSFTPEQLSDRPSGGSRFALEFDESGKAKVTVPTAGYFPSANDKRPAYLDTEIEFAIDREAKSLTISAQGRSIALGEGEWSDWMEWKFDITDKFAVHAISRFYLLEAGEQVRLYMSCFQPHPRHPRIDFSNPAAFSGELADRYGLYKTIGWAFDTHALRQDALTEDPFMQDIMRTMAWRETLTLDELDRDNFDILVSGWTATDRVGHMFWRYRDPKHPLYDAEAAQKYSGTLEATYEKMDSIVGKVLERLREDDLLFVISDHGFETFRKGFNINTWLVRNGFATVMGQTDAQTAVGEKGFLMDFDWSKTRAYAVGLSSLYLNIQGREAKGIVPPAEAEMLMAELRKRLLDVVDPDTGDKVFDAIYTREVYSGEAAKDAPDISLGYALGYQNTKGAAKGSVPKDLFEVNDDKWSGEHASSDMARVPGMLFSSVPVAENADIIDMGVTALARLGADIPTDFEGKNLV